MPAAVTPTRRRRVYLALGVVCLGLLVVYAQQCLFVSDGDNKRDSAIAKAMSVEKGCRAFHMKYGRYPASLRELIEPPPVEGQPTSPFLEGGEDAIRDSWRQLFQFQPPPSEAGQDRPLVWTVAPDGTRITNIPRQPRWYDRFVRGCGG